jgi:hypothetical protein
MIVERLAGNLNMVDSLIALLILSPDRSRVRLGAPGAMPGRG